MTGVSVFFRRTEGKAWSDGGGDNRGWELFLLGNGLIYCDKGVCKFFLEKSSSAQYLLVYLQMTQEN